MAAQTFLVVEIPGLRTLGMDFTSHHPKALIDVVMRPAAPGGNLPPGTLNACVQIRNAPPDALPGFLEDIRRRYGELRALTDKSHLGSWLGTLSIPPAAVPDPRATAVLRFMGEHGFGMQWVRVEQGIAFARYEVPAHLHASAMEERLRKFLAEQGIVADTAVEIASESDFAKWFALAASPPDSAATDPTL